MQIACIVRLDIRVAVVVDIALSIFKLRKSKKAIINVGCENNDGMRMASIAKVATVIFKIIVFKLQECENDLQTEATLGLIRLSWPPNMLAYTYFISEYLVQIYTIM